MITVRRLEEKDLPELVRLYNELWHVPTELERMRESFRRIAANPAYMVAGAFTDDGELVGSALGIVCLDMIAACRPWAMIENVIVSQRLRGQGIGRLLLSAIEEFARGQGCSYIQLTTTKPEAYGFYSSVGYSGDLVKAFRKIL